VAADCSSVSSVLQVTLDLRQSTNLGSDRPMNLIALVEYNKRFEAALKAHETCIREQLAIYSVLARTHNLQDETARRLEPHLELFQAMSNRASKLYRRLLASNPAGALVAKAASHFYQDVQHDPAFAATFERTTSGESVAEGTTSQSISSQNDRGSTFKTATMRE